MGRDSEMRTTTPTLLKRKELFDGTHKKQQTLVFTYGPAAAQEPQQEQHAAHSQNDVDSCEEKGVCCHYLSETCGVHHYPHPHTQQEGAPQL